MRLYAYRDRYTCERWGVLTDAGLLTGSRLERAGGLRPRRRTHLGIGSLVMFEDGWRVRVARATRNALTSGSKVIAVGDRGKAAAINEIDVGKIVCVGLNYREHVTEGGRNVPDRPILFAKFANAIIADGEPIVRPEGTHALDLEAELGVIIGRQARRVTPDQGRDCIAGYVVVNDVSARDWQGVKQALAEGERGDGQWLRAKGSDTFLPMGPVFVTADEIDPADGLAVRSWRIPGSGPDAGREIQMQDGNTRDMIWSVPDLISLISRQITLEPGDVIATGTPSGVGVFRDPPVFLEPGDRVRVEVEGIGSVENPIVDWTDDPRGAEN